MTYKYLLPTLVTAEKIIVAAHKAATNRLNGEVDTATWQSAIEAAAIYRAIQELAAAVREDIVMNQELTDEEAEADAACVRERRALERVEEREMLESNEDDDDDQTEEGE
jgi:hypothetical protein